MGEAIRLLNLGGVQIYAELMALLDTLPRLDRPRALELAEAAATRGADDKFDLLITLIDLALARLARTGATGHPPARSDRGRSRHPVAAVPHGTKRRAHGPSRAQEISARLQHGRAVNLDPAALVLDTVFKIQQTAAG